MRKLIYYVATTLDGFIANEDGSFEGFSWDDNFMADLLAEFPETIPAHLKEQSSSQDAIKMVQSLKNKQGKAIWLCGGADLAGQMLEENLIDRLIVKLNPVVFGSGISLFSGGVQPKDLKLTESKAYKSGHMMLYYLAGRS